MVINLGGNKYRLILEVFFESGVILVRHVLTHEDHDSGLWKEAPGPREAGEGKAPKRCRRKGGPDA